MILAIFFLPRLKEHLFHLTHNPVGTVPYGGIGAPPPPPSLTTCAQTMLPGGANRVEKKDFEIDIFCPAIFPDCLQMELHALMG